MDTTTTLKLAVSPIAPALQYDDPNSPKNIERRHSLKIAERDATGRLYKGSVLQHCGRPPGLGPTVTTLARAYTEQAINLLGTIMCDEGAPQSARVQAAGCLLDRAWGKSALQVDVNVRQRFDSFLREIGAAARAERELIQAAPLDTDG